MWGVNFKSSDPVFLGTRSFIRPMIHKDMEPYPIVEYTLKDCGWTIKRLEIVCLFALPQNQTNFVHSFVWKRGEKAFRSDQIEYFEHFFNFRNFQPGEREVSSKPR